jgi:hypothetical protein
MIKPTFSIFFTTFGNNLSLYNGFYWVKIKNLKNFFKIFNGRDFAKQLRDMEDQYDRIKPTKDLQDTFPEILEESNKIRESLKIQLRKMSQSEAILGEFKHFYEYYIRFRKIEAKIQTIKKNLQEAEMFKKDIENLKEIYNDMMDNYLRKIVDHHFKNLNFNNLIEFEDINFYSFILNQFDNYLFRLFKFVLLKRPNIIKKKSIEVNQLNMIHDNLNIDLINELVIENTLHDLFYNNYEEIFKYANDPLGLEVKIESKDISILNGFKQIKNLFSHGDGTVNSLMVKKFQTFKIGFPDLGLNDISLGEKIPINIKLVKELEKLIFTISLLTDKSLISKYPEIIDTY